MDHCIFCKILYGESDGSFVYRGENVSAFMDIDPLNDGHILIVPNGHYERFDSVDDDVASELFKTAKTVLRAVEDSSLKCEAANIFLSDGETAGQEVPHCHLHVVPRFKGDGLRMVFFSGSTSKKTRSSLDKWAKEISGKLDL